MSILCSLFLSLSFNLAFSDVSPTDTQWNEVNGLIQDAGVYGLNERMKDVYQLSRWQKLNSILGRSQRSTVELISQAIEESLDIKLDQQTARSVGRFFQWKPYALLHLAVLAEEYSIEENLRLTPKTAIMILREALDDRYKGNWELLTWIEENRILSAKFVSALNDLLSSPYVEANILMSLRRGDAGPQDLAFWLQFVMQQKSWSPDFVEAFAKIPSFVFAIHLPKEIQNSATRNFGSYIEGKDRLNVRHSMHLFTRRGLDGLFTEYLILDYKNYDSLVRFTKHHYNDLSLEVRANLFHLLKDGLSDRPDLAESFKKVWPEYLISTVFKRQMHQPIQESELENKRDVIVSFDYFKMRQRQCSRLFTNR